MTRAANLSMSNKCNFNVSIMAQWVSEIIKDVTSKLDVSCC